MTNNNKYTSSNTGNNGFNIHFVNLWNSQRIPFVIKKFLFAIYRSGKRLFLYRKLKKLNSNYYKYNLSREFGPQKQICYAPEKNLYFGMDGNITACCFSRSYVLGNINENNIAGIWQGPKIAALRHALKNNDLSLACHTCKQMIESGNIDAADSSFYDQVPFRKKIPSRMEFELSNECNLECIMCSPDISSSISRRVHGTNIYPDKYGDDFLKQLDDFIPHLTSTKFLGGEPFLIPIYYKIWDKILKTNPTCDIVVQTNATVLNKKIIDMLEKGNFHISISMESFKKQTYEKIRKNADFETVMQNFNYFAAHARRHNYVLGIAICPMRQNWQDLPEMILKANELDASVYFNTVWKPDECSLHSLSHEELSVIINTLSAYNLPDSTCFEKKNKFHFECFISQLKTWQLSKKNHDQN